MDGSVSRTAELEISDKLPYAIDVQAHTNGVPALHFAPVSLPAWARQGAALTLSEEDAELVASASENADAPVANPVIVRSRRP